MADWRTRPFTFAAGASIRMSPFGRSNCQPSHATVNPCSNRKASLRVVASRFIRSNADPGAVGKKRAIGLGDAAVGNFEQNRVPRSRRIPRTHQNKIAGELNPAFRVARREGDIGNAPARRDSAGRSQNRRVPAASRTDQPCPERDHRARAVVTISTRVTSADADDAENAVHAIHAQITGARLPIFI